MIVGLVAALLAAVVVAPIVAATPALAAAPASARVAKVVLIVGPSGAATDRYREEARAAAALARKYTADVTELYSPDATWPAVKEALQGASVVIYMGHGNGWPSRYRDHLYPPTQNGFGLNPSAGSGDDEHQYFGEARIAESVRLARNAVVLLNHLCYASGNTEPGLPEGTLDMAKQRVDNFAAGFIGAGASAVVAEAHASPNHMLKVVLGGRGGIEAAWRGAPTSNDNVFAFESQRSEGYVAQMDPEHPESGFTRSIVLKRGLASADVLRNARGRAGAAAPAIDPIELAPTLAGSGLKLKTPSLRATFAGSAAWYRIPFTARTRDAVPAGLQASVRWDPLDAAPPEPPGPDAAADPDTPPNFGLVIAEQLGEVVAPTKVEVDEKNLSIKVANPASPGRYRLTVTLHDKEGVAYDAATQAMVSGLIVRITGPHDAVVVAPESVEIEPGATQSMTVWVTNVGHHKWGVAPEPGARTRGESNHAGRPESTNAIVSGAWVALGEDAGGTHAAAAAAATVTPGDLPPGLDTRGVARTDVVLTAPTETGDYLLIIDIVTPERGSLAALGVDPTIVRVHVTEAP